MVSNDIRQVHDHMATRISPVRRKFLSVGPTRPLPPIGAGNTGSQADGGHRRDHQDHRPVSAQFTGRTSGKCPRHQTPCCHPHQHGFMQKKGIQEPSLLATHLIEEAHKKEILTQGTLFNININDTCHNVAMKVDMQRGIHKEYVLNSQDEDRLDNALLQRSLDKNKLSMPTPREDEKNLMYWRILEIKVDSFIRSLMPLLLTKT